PDPEPAERLAVELVDDRSEAVMAARAAALAEPELAERQREIVDDHEHLAQRRVLAGEDLPDGPPRLVHERQRLHEHDVESVEPPADDRGGVLVPATTGPPGPIGETVEDHPADVVAGLGVLLAR